MACLFSKPPLIPTPTDEDGRLVPFGGSLLIEFLPSAEPGSRMRMVLKAGSLSAGRNTPHVPPYHYHWYQTETFHVTAGTLAYRLDGKEGTAGAGESVVIPPGALHTFWMPEDAAEDLDITVVTAGGDRRGLDEYFIRNLYGYFHSCHDKGVDPNPIQVLTMTNNADIVLADPPLGIGRLLNFVVGGLIGPYLFGTKTGYKEFETSAQ